MLGIQLLLALIGSVAAVIVRDINSDVDYTLKYWNLYFQRNDMSEFTFPGGKFGEQNYFSEGIATGMDSFERTGDCTYTVSEEDLTFSFDYYIGQRLLVFIFNQIEYNGLNQTAIARINSNSLHIKFTAYTQYECNITVDDVSLVKFEKVEFYSSIKENNKANMETTVRDTVLPKVNQLLKEYAWPWLQEYLSNTCSRDPSKLLTLSLFDLFAEPLAD